MNTATLTRPALTPLPAPRPGAFVAPGLDPRPCVTNPPQWWDTGNTNNDRATELCRTACPLYGAGACKPEPGEVGMIRDGIPYGDTGKPARVCDTCRRAFGRGTPHATSRCEPCRRSAARQHHHRIMTMRQAGRSFAAIGRAIGCSDSTIRHYVARHEARGQVAA